MRTFLDYLGWNPAASFRSRAVLCCEDDGDGSSSETGTETSTTPSSTTVSPVISPSGYVSLDATADSVVQSSPGVTFTHMGQTYDNVLDYHDAIFGNDDDPAPASTTPVTSTVTSTSVPIVDYSNVDLSGLPLLPQEIPVEYKDTESGIEKVIDFYSPPELGYDLRDPNEPSVMLQDGEPFSGIAYGMVYESGQPVGSVSMDNIAGLGKLELSDPLAPTGSTTKISSPGGVGPGQTVDFNRLIDAGGTQDYEIYLPPLSDDDIDLPDISDDPYSATVLPYYEPGSDEVVDSTPVPDVNIPSNKNVIDAVVAGVLTGTPVEGFDIQTSKIGMPREGLLGDLNNLFGSLGGQIILDSLIPGAGLVAGFASVVDPQKRQRIADMLSGYSGQAVYNSKGELIGAVDT